MSFYYSREPGTEGEILTEEGDAPGVALSDLLDRGPLPIKAAMELVAYVADVLTIAEEDGEVHGDIKPGYIKVDPTGVVSVDGYGVTRRGGRAPEGRPVGMATDVYGLGVVMYAVLSSESLGAIPRDRDAHDDAIVDKLMAIDWQELSDKRWLDDVRHFLCTMLAFDPSERPQALDVANVISHVASQAGGEGLVAWANRVCSGRAGRRAPATPVHEDLGGPEALGGPVTSTNAFKVRKAASAKGESTAFWSREKIAAMLAEEGDENLEGPAPVARPPSPPPPPDPRLAPPVPDSTIPGGGAPPPPPPRNLAARPAPPPAAEVGPSAAPARPTPPPRPPPPRNLAARPAPPPVAEVGPSAAPARPAPPPVASPGAAGGASASPSASPFATVGKAASSGPVASASAEVVEPTPKKRGALVKILIGVAILGVLGCIGGSIAGLTWWLHSAEKSPSTEASTFNASAEKKAGAEEGEKAADQSKAVEQGEDEAADTATAPPPAPEAAPSPPPAPKPRATTHRTSTHHVVKPRATTTHTSPSATEPASRSTGAATSADSTPSVGEPVTASTTASSLSPMTVKFVVRGKKAQIRCGNGKEAEFVGSIRMEFDSLTTCLIQVDQAKGVVQTTRSGTFTCSVGDAQVTCVLK